MDKKEVELILAAYYKKKIGEEHFKEFEKQVITVAEALSK